jgi:hypothetical protein
MTKQFRAVLIDPEKQPFRIVVTTGKIEDICSLIGASHLDSFRITEHETNFDYGWVDDLGLRTSGKPVHAFKFDIRSHDPIAGRCLVLGTDKEGETTNARMPVEFLRNHIVWLGLITPEVFWEETDHGARAIITYARVKA